MRTTEETKQSCPRFTILPLGALGKKKKTCGMQRVSVFTNTLLITRLRYRKFHVGFHPMFFTGFRLYSNGAWVTKLFLT